MVVEMKHLLYTYSKVVLPLSRNSYFGTLRCLEELGYMLHVAEDLDEMYGRDYEKTEYQAALEKMRQDLKRVEREDDVEDGDSLGSLLESLKQDNHGFKIIDTLKRISDRVEAMEIYSLKEFERLCSQLSVILMPAFLSAPYIERIVLKLVRTCKKLEVDLESKVRNFVSSLVDHSAWPLF